MSCDGAPGRIGQSRRGLLQKHVSARADHMPRDASPYPGLCAARRARNSTRLSAFSSLTARFAPVQTCTETSARIEEADARR